MCNYRHPEPRRVWWGGSETQLLTPFPPNLANPALCSTKLDFADRHGTLKPTTLPEWALGPWAQGPWARGPEGPWAHGLMGPWALGPMGPWSHEPMGPWAHGPMGPRLFQKECFSKNNSICPKSKTNPSKKNKPLQKIGTLYIYINMDAFGEMFRS